MTNTQGKLETMLEQISKRDVSLMLMCILVLVIYQLFLTHNYRLNIDEFHFLSQVYDFQRNTLSLSLQTLHVHVFSWLPGISGNEVSRINSGRVVMLLAEVTTITAIVLSAKVFVSTRIAVLTGLVWLASGYTLIEGFSFRTDPLACALLMSSLCLSLSPSLNLGKAILAGFLLGVAGMVTIKSALYAPAFLAAILWQLKSNNRNVFVLLAAAICSASMTFTVLYLLHSSSLAHITQGSAEFATKAIGTTFLDSSLFPDLNSLVGWLILSLAPAFFIARSLSGNLLAFLFFAPLLSVIIYKNAFPYFYPFITAPVMLSFAMGIEKFTWGKKSLALFVLLIVSSVVLNLLYGTLAHQKFQKQVVQSVHTIFPKPVPYIDQIGMVASFQKQGFYMTNWGMKNYQHSGKAIMDDILAEQSPPLLIANHEVLLAAMDEIEQDQNRLYLFPEDNQALKSAYVKYWGMIYIAGFKTEIDTNEKKLEIKIAGNYRNMSNAPVTINQQEYLPGDIARLERGFISLSSSTPTTASFIWAEAQPAPDTLPPPAKIIF